MAFKEEFQALWPLAIARYHESRKYTSDAPLPSPLTRQNHDTCAAWRESEVLAHATPRSFFHDRQETYTLKSGKGMGWPLTQT